MSDNESIITATASRIFSDFADPQTINRAGDDGWKALLWQALSDAGLPLAWVAEEHGGSGVTVADGFEILTVAGRFAVSVPLAETLLAGWLLAKGEIWSPPGAMTVAPVRPGDRIVLQTDGTLAGRARGVPFASDAGHLAVLAHSSNGSVIALVEGRVLAAATGRTLAGDPTSVLVFDGVRPIEVAAAPTGFDQTALMLMGCAVRSVETAGALETILTASVRYANERVAFERPIAKFQAVQHNLARLAGEVAAAMTAAGSAADAIANADHFDDAIFLEATAAKIRSAEAAEEGAAIAHQVHGAIGFTQEHILHRFTLRLLAWRDDFGNESHWAVELGRRVAARGAEAFWPLAASR